MKRGSTRRVDELLHSGVESARRAPAPEMRARIDDALAASTTAKATGRAAPRALIGRPISSRSWRATMQDMIVAASVLAAVGIWTFAFVRDLPSGAGAPARGENPAENDIGENDIRSRSEQGEDGDGFARENSTSPAMLAQIAFATPAKLHTAIDDSLFSELGNIVHDAARATHFLVGRLPVPLVTRATEDSPR